MYIYICPTSLNLCGTNLFISVAFFPAKLQEIILRALSHGVRAAKKDTADASAPNFQLKVPRPICLALIDLKDNIWQYELSLIADVNFLGILTVPLSPVLRTMASMNQFKQWTALFGHG